MNEGNLPKPPTVIRHKKLHRQEPKDDCPAKVAAPAACKLELYNDCPGDDFPVTGKSSSPWFAFARKQWGNKLFLIGGIVAAIIAFLIFLLL